MARGGSSPAKLELYEELAKSILMADGTTRPMRALRVGDRLVGTTLRDKYRYFVETEVRDHWSTVKPAWRVSLDDGTELIASADHRFLSERGWKHVTGAEQGRARRPHLTLGNRMIGTGAFATGPRRSESYREGYLCGVVRGDAHLKVHRYPREGRRHGDQHHFRLALADFEPLHRTHEYLLEMGIETRWFLFAPARAGRKEMRGIRTHARTRVERIRSLIEWPEVPSGEWHRGFLAGISTQKAATAGACFASPTPTLS